MSACLCVGCRYVGSVVVGVTGVMGDWDWDWNDKGGSCVDHVPWEERVPLRDNPGVVLENC